LLQALALLAMLALAGASAPAARADGDPASDVLATQRLFLPQDAAASSGQQAELTALVRQAGRNGYPIRVALIASATDLGSVTALWKQPQNYARFLGQELSLVYRGPLLVVMPNGFGLYNAGPGGVAALGGPRATGQVAGLTDAALTAIQSLASAAGHPVRIPPPSADVGAGGHSTEILPFIVFAFGAALIALAWTASLRAQPLRLRRRQAGGIEQ
jgi:hypothetical protein